MFADGDHVVDYVDDFLHGALELADAQYVREHCAECRICAVAMGEAKQRHAAMRDVPAVEASEQLIEKTLAKVEGEKVLPAWVGRVTHVLIWGTAVSVLILGCLHLHFNSLSASPFDLRLLGQRDLLAGTTATLRVAVFDRSSDRPMSNVPVELRLANQASGEQVTLASFQTDARGFASPQFSVPDWPDGDYALRATASTGSTPESLDLTIRLKRSWKLMLSTDKPVYQPGQRIRMRSLALRRPDLKPVGDEQVIFSITDPAGNIIFKQRDLTSQFGIASADCPLATEILEGGYRIECQVGDTVSSRSAEVQKYVLPKFKIDLALDKPFYAPGEKASGTVRAHYFFGKPVAGADAVIKVYEVGATASSLTTIQEKTDETGWLAFEFVVPETMAGQERDRGAAELKVTARIADTAGQSQETSVTRPVAAEPIRVEVIPESGKLVAGVPNIIYVYTSYLDGRPAQTRLTIGGRAGNVETNTLGIGTFEMTPVSFNASNPNSPRDQSVGVAIVATDNEGRRGRCQVDLRTDRCRFLLRTDKAVYDGGETMTLAAIGGGLEPIFVELVKDGQSYLAETMDMTDGRGELQLDLPPDLFGTIAVYAYRFGWGGVSERQSRVVHIRQIDEINIAATLDRDEYRPGETAQLRLQLTDSSGNAAPGAVSLAAVDEAVFSVLQQSTGLARTFFLLDKQLLEPVYAIYNWSPDFQAPGANDEDRAMFEKAMFARASDHAFTSETVQNELLPLLDYSERIFDVLERPDWEQLARQADMSESTIEMLRNYRAPHTLEAASFPAKAQDVIARRRAAMPVIEKAWEVLLIVVFVCTLVWLARWNAVYIALGLLCCGLGMALFLPAMLYSALESSRSASAISDLHQIQIASEMAAGKDVDVGGADELGGGDAPRVRQWFPETLLWKPELITDDQGRASLEVDLADSITTWRLSASAVSGSGQLGGAEFPIHVFQPFFVDLDLPVALTRNDEVSVPVVVYNYLDEPQTVQLRLEAADWFSRLDPDGDGDDSPPLELQPGEVRSLHYRIKVLKVGQQQLQVTARGSGIADAVRRDIEVVADGLAVEQIASGTLSQPFETTVEMPTAAIDGSVRAIVKLYPSTFSQLVEGLDAIFQMPSGCFEQTSSTTYPNVLALDYLRRTKKSVPAIEAKARQYIHVGYQRLVSFEVAGGGFDWFGNPPANTALTAYGLMEFADMARVHQVDPRLMDRTRDWLLRQRRSDGSWLGDGRISVADSDDLDFATTAYVAWSVFASDESDGRHADSAPTLDYLLSRPPASIDNPYVLALVANAVAAVDPRHPQLGVYLARLDAMKGSRSGGKQCWWEMPGAAITTFYGTGLSSQIETTATAALAMIAAGKHQGTVRGALAWLVEQKDARGTWHSTQATVLALKALLAGTGQRLAGDVPRAIEVVVDGEVVRTAKIPVDQWDVMQQIDVSAEVATPGAHTVRLAENSDAGTGYQFALRFHVEAESRQPQAPEALAIDVAYDRTRLAVDDRVTCTAIIKNNLPSIAPMVIVDLPIPGGFTIERGELDELVGSGKIAKYQITPRKAIVYLRQLGPGWAIELRYRLRATMPVKVAVPPVEAYHYYDPARRGGGGATSLEVTAGT